ncbi:DNA-binding protein [Paraburkholderia sediminicola]|uniref:DNA-binding protein n=1 Tax=Paraburkholderia sediminicola TaxID=458836 RepID=UPI0038B741A3
MAITQLTATPDERSLLSTEALAAILKLRPSSIRKRYSETGAYFCLRPVKLPNGRLMWPGDSLEQLMGAAK